MSQTQTNNPDVLEALERVLAGRKSRSEEAEQVRLLAQREAQAPRLNTLVPPPAEQASAFVLVQLSYDPKNLASLKSLGDVLLTDPATGGCCKLDLVAGLPHWVEARYLADGWAQRECKKLADAGLLTIQMPGRDNSWVVNDCTMWGKMLGRVATGQESGRLDTGKPSTTPEELERAIPIVATGAPELAAALAKLVRGATVPLVTFLPAGSYYGGAERPVQMR